MNFMKEIILLPKIIQVVNFFCAFRCMHVFSGFSSPTETSCYGLNSNYFTKLFDSSNASFPLYFSTSTSSGKKHQETPQLLVSSTCNTLYLFIGQPIFFADVLVNFFNKSFLHLYNVLSETTYQIKMT